MCGWLSEGKGRERYSGKKQWNANHKTVRNYVRSWILSSTDIPGRQLWVALNTGDTQLEGSYSF